MCIRRRDMSHHSRFLLSAFAVVWMCIPALPAMAHDGPHGPDILIEVERATVSDMQVDLRLTLTGLGGPLVLRGVHASGASGHLRTPVSISFAEDVGVDAVLSFASDPPEVFTLMLDFGTAGISEITVIPDNKLH
ncbi:hypothetical protein [uncultured Tateyamaria sp.]|uniref:hypothetical protein n=2 Tax=uncultured Tateyamaria sp. TaxID=455651 RepID=UPI0026114E6F|nr:hypothetical protein [uncultured Tateyamaria sp.]